MSWHYTSEKIDVLLKQVALGVARASEPLSPLTATREDGSTFVVSAGEVYPAASETVTLERAWTVPAEWGGQRVYAAFEVAGAESLAYVDGEPRQAIDLFHHDLLIAESAAAGTTHRLTLEAYTGSVDSNNNTGWMGGLASSSARVEVRVKVAEMRWIDRATESFYFDFLTARRALNVIDPNSKLYATLRNALDGAANLIDLRYGPRASEFYASVAEASQHLRANWYDKVAADPDMTPQLCSVGHAHIDTAWLWPISHTRKKIARTFRTQLTLIDRYRDDLGYVFTCSQPQQYKYLKQDYPEIYNQVKQAVASGRWETVGGMWVESDCNVVSGESLVRQFLFGQRFFEQEFGAHNDVLWLPDVFGYAANIPQIIKKSGMKYFMTIKIYWSQINKPPYQTFEWEGIDGTRVLTHFAPGGDYNANMTPEQTVSFWNAYDQKSLNDTTLYIYGHGDGGGGPTRQMLETAKRLKSFAGMPRIAPSSAQSFFETLERQVADKGRSLPRWVGELYLEYHRGTYTSQAKNKLLNRRSEIGLQSAEQIASVAMTLAGAAYPREAINSAWETVLLNQFHDIIPGSSINAVYRDSDKDYDRVMHTIGEVAASALKTIASSAHASAGDVVLYNPLPWARKDFAAVPTPLAMTGQDTVDLDGNAVTLVPASSAPPSGYAVITRGEREPSGAADSMTVLPDTLENRFFRIELDSNREIRSLIDKRTGREVIDTGSYCKGNALLSFEDRPMTYDAWDIDIFYQDKMYPVQQMNGMRIVERGPLRATVELTRKFGRGTTITQRISIWRDLPRIDFDTLVDWQERSTLLKAAFPVTVHSPKATYDIQFGNLERPTHWNTSWDWARFEVCAHKWADLSEGSAEDGYGVALLSDSKYGWDIRGNVMRLTLLKGAESPDKEADLGRHRFCYSLMPHVGGDWRSAGVAQRAYELNVPVLAAAVAATTGRLPDRVSFVQADEPNLIVETLKKAEDDDALIVRLYESYGQRGAGSLRFYRDVKSAVEVSLMEKETDETRASGVRVSGPAIGFTYGPYEIKTFKVRL